MPTLADQLHMLRRQVAAYTRNHPDPPHGADGRFYSGGISGAKLPTEHLSQHGETPRPIASQCPECGKITSSWHPQAGQHLPLASAEPRSHGSFCPDCQRAWFQREMLARFMDKLGMTHEQAMQHIDAIVAAAQEQAAALDRERAAQYQQWLHEQATPQRAMYAQFAERLAAIRMQVATVVRNATWTDAHGNTWEVIQGAGGKFEQVILLSHGPGQEHVAPPVGTKLGVHEASRMLREKEGLPEEHVPVKNLEDLPPVATLDNYHVDAFAPLNIGLLYQKYGDAQLGAALKGFDLNTLRRAAVHIGATITGIRNNKAALITAIVAHVTRDEATGIPRYSADFRTAGRTGAKSAADKATTEHPDLEPYRRELARLHQQYHDLLAARPDLAKQLEAHQKTAAGGKATTKLGNDADPLDVWRKFGGSRASVYAALKEESEGRLLVLLGDKNMPPGPEPRARTANALAKAIADRLDAHFNGATKATGGAGKSKTEKAPPLDRIAASMERLPDLNPDGASHEFYQSTVDGKAYFLKPSGQVGTQSAEMAYQVARQLGLGEFVSPSWTVEHAGRTYQVMPMIPGTQMGQAASATWKAALAKIDPVMRAKLGLYSVMMGMNDVAGNNVMLTPNGHLVMIDTDDILHGVGTTPVMLNAYFGNSLGLHEGESERARAARENTIRGMAIPAEAITWLNQDILAHQGALLDRIDHVAQLHDSGGHENAKWSAYTDMMASAMVRFAALRQIASMAHPTWGDLESIVWWKNGKYTENSLFQTVNYIGERYSWDHPAHNQAEVADLLKQFGITLTDKGIIYKPKYPEGDEE